MIESIVYALRRGMDQYAQQLHMVNVVSALNSLITTNCGTIPRHPLGSRTKRRHGRRQRAKQAQKDDKSASERSRHARKLEPSTSNRLQSQHDNQVKDAATCAYTNSQTLKRLRHLQNRVTIQQHILPHSRAALPVSAPPLHARLDSTHLMISKFREG